MKKKHQEKVISSFLKKFSSKKIQTKRKKIKRRTTHTEISELTCQTVNLNDKVQQYEFNLSFRQTFVCLRCQVMHWTKSICPVIDSIFTKKLFQFFKINSDFLRLDSPTNWKIKYFQPSKLNS